jgi:hypothetical protein
VVLGEGVEVGQVFVRNVGRWYGCGAVVVLARRSAAMVAARDCRRVRSVSSRSCSTRQPQNILAKQ